jgi:transposase
MLFVCGIDVSKATLDACLLAEGAARPAFASFANDEGGFEALARWALSLAPGGGVRFAMEHTGCYHRALLRSLRSRGLAALALNARRCRDLAKGLGVLDKDDRVDAEVVARCVLMSRPCARPEPPAREALREVSHRVEQLKGQLAKERTRLKEPRLSARVEASIRRSIAWLEGELEAVEAGWLEALEDAPELMAAYRLALTVPQVGPCTARALVSELPDASDVGDPRRLCALSGLVPRRRRSGASLQAPDRLSPCCNRRLKKAMYMPAVQALRRSPELRAFHDRLVLAGKHPSQALAAVGRKILLRALVVLARGTPWQKRPLTT